MVSFTLAPFRSDAGHGSLSTRLAAFLRCFPQLWRNGSPRGWRCKASRIAS